MSEDSSDINLQTYNTIPNSIERIKIILGHYRSLSGDGDKNEIGDYSHLRDLVTDVMHYVTENNLGDGPYDILDCAQEVFEEEQGLENLEIEEELTNPQSWYP